MNKQQIDQWIPEAYKILADIGIAKDGRIKNTYRGQISTFGAALMNGSLLAAVSFFSDDGGASVHRSKITMAVMRLIDPDYAENHTDKGALFTYIKDRNQRDMKEKVMNATIALKLAMNLYNLVR